VVFLDIGMPGMSGHEVAEKLRVDPALAGTLLVALTGWGTDEDRRRSKDAGFDFHLTKPVDLDQVQTVLDALRE
jgi:CheY-like chemotaxis protein